MALGCRIESSLSPRRTVDAGDGGRRFAPRRVLRDPGRGRPAGDGLAHPAVAGRNRRATGGGCGAGPEGALDRGDCRRSRRRPARRVGCGAGVVGRLPVLLGRRLPPDRRTCRFHPVAAPAAGGAAPELVLARRLQHGGGQRVAQSGAEPALRRPGGECVVRHRCRRRLRTPVWRGDEEPGLGRRRLRPGRRVRHLRPRRHDERGGALRTGLRRGSFRSRRTRRDRRLPDGARRRHQLPESVPAGEAAAAGRAAGVHRARGLSLPVARLRGRRGALGTAGTGPWPGRRPRDRRFQLRHVDSPFRAWPGHRGRDRAGGDDRTASGRAPAQERVPE